MRKDMIRKIIKIDEAKCNGCGACAEACHEGAIGMVNGKAKLLREDYCDGLGDCLPACPTGAITFEEREAAAYDEAAVLDKAVAGNAGTPGSTGVPGSTAAGCTAAKAINGTAANAASGTAEPHGDRDSTGATSADAAPPKSQLAQWPVQIKLAPINAPYFENAELLIAADCTAYAFADFHREFMAGRITLIGCPKLDAIDYSEKLTEIFRANDIRSIAVTRMEVPCCGGLEFAVKKAVAGCGRDIPVKVTTISLGGEIL